MRTLSLTAWLSLAFPFLPALAGEAPIPGRQVARQIGLPANPNVVAPRTDAERAAERARRAALSPAELEAERARNRKQHFDTLREPKPLDPETRETVSYWLFLPAGYEENGADQWPLLLYLHGSGERGSHLQSVLTNGPAKMLNDPEIAKTWPFITVSPQCPDNAGWSPPQLAELLDEIQGKYRVDPVRVSVTGLSMGGFATWSLLHAYPDRFAAGVPICGGFDPEAAGRLVDVPIWTFHGAKDPNVPVSMSVDMVDAIRRAGGEKVRLTIYPDEEHVCWPIAYEETPELWEWILEQRAPAPGSRFKP